MVRLPVALVVVAFLLEGLGIALGGLTLGVAGFALGVGTILVLAVLAALKAPRG